MIYSWCYFKEEFYSSTKGLADWYEMQQIESLDQRFNEVYNLFLGRMGTLEDRISKWKNNKSERSRRY